LSVSPWPLQLGLAMLVPTRAPPPAAAALRERTNSNVAPWIRGGSLPSPGSCSGKGTAAAGHFIANGTCLCGPSPTRSESWPKPTLVWYTYVVCHSICNSILCYVSSRPVWNVR
jgi:hypothetical protein